MDSSPKRRQDVSKSPLAGLITPTMRTSLRVRVLKPRHAPAMLRHLLALSEPDRYLRFGYLPTGEQIERFVARLDHSQCTLFGIFDDRLELLGMAQLSYIATSIHQQANTAEFGVSVEVKCRGMGFGRALFNRCIAHARNQGVQHLIVHALSENATMIQMARSAGATIERDGGDSMAHIKLPPPTFKTMWQATLYDRWARTDYYAKRMHRHIARYLSRLGLLFG
ncbi:GNAT family N-acetyltransferase [Comamonadaceae bacterium M7527]|nr:GNAT family N-acetyltransferase [Comamonadaceae bacterium M7527]